MPRHVSSDRLTTVYRHAARFFWMDTHMQASSPKSVMPLWLLIVIVGTIVGVSMGRSQSMGLYLQRNYDLTVLQHDSRAGGFGPADATMGPWK